MDDIKRRTFSFGTAKSREEVSAILLEPAVTDRLVVLAHGAGAGIKSPFMEKLALELATNKIASLRFNFPYMEAGRKTPGPAGVSAAAVRSAVKTAANIMPGVTLFAGGKSYGGRMTSTAESEEHLERVRGIIFFGFPLHPPGKPSVERSEHLKKIRIPMLFLQGSRDAFAGMKLMRPLCKSLGKLAQLNVTEGADHSFRMNKSSAIKDEDVIKKLASDVKIWSEELRV